MKRLLFVVLAAALLWSGYWFIGARGVSAGLTAWFDARRADGWVAEYDDFSVRGFPNRFDATWQDLTLADPDTGIALTLPIFQFLSLSYRPNHVIAAWPPEMTLATPTDRVRLTNDTLRASIRLGTTAELELERAVLEGKNLELSGAATGSMETLSLAAERTGATTYRIGADARDLTPPASLLKDILGDQAFPHRVQSVHLDATATFDRAWDLSAIEVSRPQPTAITLTDLSATWGVMEFRATGDLTIDNTGLASGPLTLEAKEWQEMLAIAEATGTMSDLVAQAARGLLSMAAEASGDPNTIDVDLTARDGFMYYGVLPVGPMPRIILR